MRLLSSILFLILLYLSIGIPYNLSIKSEAAIGISASKQGNLCAISVRHLDNRLIITDSQRKEIHVWSINPLIQLGIYGVEESNNALQSFALKKAIQLSLNESSQWYGILGAEIGGNECENLIVGRIQIGMLKEQTVTPSFTSVFATNLDKSHQDCIRGIAETMFNDDILFGFRGDNKIIIVRKGDIKQRMRRNETAEFMNFQKFLDGSILLSLTVGVLHENDVFALLGDTTAYVTHLVQYKYNCNDPLGDFLIANRKIILLPEIGTAVIAGLPDETKILLIHANRKKLVEDKMFEVKITDHMRKNEIQCDDHPMKVVDCASFNINKMLAIISYNPYIIGDSVTIKIFSLYCRNLLTSFPLKSSIARPKLNSPRGIFFFLLMLTMFCHV